MSVDLAKVQSIQVESECYSPCEHNCKFTFIGGTEKNIMCSAAKIAEFYKTASDKVYCSLGKTHFERTAKQKRFCVIY
jgi:hypothetical protein